MMFIAHYIDPATNCAHYVAGVVRVSGSASEFTFTGPEAYKDARPLSSEDFERFTRWAGKYGYAFGYHRE
jgi:hypothetical protein